MSNTAYRWICDWKEFARRRKRSVRAPSGSCLDPCAFCGFTSGHAPDCAQNIDFFVAYRLAVSTPGVVWPKRLRPNRVLIDPGRDYSSPREEGIQQGRHPDTAPRSVKKNAQNGGVISEK